ncbi:hypothetical protein LTR94_026789 [Friedmanniomyces endolithicus]|nr:hypothetical protein LTR94_026789 [Friedmanniomyces endolithicus]
MTDTSLIVERLLSDVAPYVDVSAGPTIVQTPTPRLSVWSSPRPTPPASAMFSPMFYAVLQGVKVLRLGENRFDLSAGDCASSSFGLPFTAGLEKATPQKPYVAIRLDLDIDLLIEVMLDMPRVEDHAFSRLVGLVSSPQDRAVLNRPYERELYYRLLQSPMGDTLRQLGQRDNRLRQIKTAADWLTSHAQAPVVVAELAASVGMSPTSFYRHFKAVTGFSPLAFQRQMRLLEARRLLASGGVSVSKVAFEAGYVSPSQFSREYKSLFGEPPAATRSRATAGLAA